MATNVSPGTVWELRPDGSSLNGGGFDASYSGVDYSQQAAAQLTVSDLASTGGTTYTSATGGFTAAMVGNVLNAVIAGNHFPVTITAFTNSNTVTGFIGFGSSFSGAAAKVGGAMTIGAFGFDPLGQLTTSFDGAKIWVRGTNSAGVAANYTNSVVTNFSQGGSQTAPLTIEGYATTRGDGGMFTLTLAGSDWLAMTAGYASLKNAHLIGASGWKCGVSIQANYCLIDNILIEPNANSAAAALLDSGGFSCVIRRVFFKTSSKDTWVVDEHGGNNVYEHNDFGSVAGSASGHAIQLSAIAFFRNCLFRDCSGSGIACGTGAAGRFTNCNFWNNTGDNVHLSNATTGILAFEFEDCIFGKAGGYDLNYTPADLTALPRAAEWSKSYLRGNWFFTTGTGRYRQLPAATDDTTLTGDPFLGAAGGNFGLNPASAAGAAIINKPRAVTLPDGSTSYITAGAITPGVFVPPVVTPPAASQLSPSIDQVLFPVDLSRGAAGGPAWRTVVVSSASGREQRVQQWADPRGEWTIAAEQLDPTRYALVRTFWYARSGRARGFRLHLQDDYIATNEPLYPAGQNSANPVKGAATAQLVKSYGDAANSYVRNIYAPVSSPAVTLRKNGSNLAYTSIDLTTGLVTLTAVATQAITGISVSATAVITFASAPVFVIGDLLYLTGIVGMLAANGLVVQVTGVGAFTVNTNVNSSGFSAYVSSGAATKYLASTDVLDASFNFDIAARFDSDAPQIENSDVGIKNFGSIRIVELKG